MILGIGIDSIEIARFAHWSTYSQKKLQRIFTPEEIEYCLQEPIKSAERFALRFAAKEAFYKAWCSWQKSSEEPFLTIGTKFSLFRHSDGRITAQVEWHNLPIISSDQSLKILVSATHTQSIATAIVLLQV